MYISLHNHSCYSIFDGFSKIEDIVARAKELNQHSIALTEHGTLSSVIPFYKECKKHKINPIIGNEFYMCPTVTIKDRKQIYHLILLAKNNEGYYNLKKLDTLAYENMYYKPRIDIDMLKLHHSGIICLSACMGSILNTENAEYWANELKSIFKENFYLEFQCNSMEEQKIYNNKMIELSKKLDTPLVVTSDSHYPNKESAKYHKYWVNLNKGENDYYPVDDFWIKGEQDIFNEMKGIIPDEILKIAIDNTENIANQCNVDITVGGNHYPIFPVEDKLEAIKEICREGWKSKIIPYVPREERQEYVDRFNYEIDVLEKCDYLNYLLITHDILNWCKQNDILTGIGRGSCGGSLVCYLMDITKLDPLPHGLLFERFVNPERVSAADIDNDLEDIRRQDVINYVKEKYGYVYNIRTFNYLGVKGSIQRAGQALKLEPQTVISLSKNAESFDNVKGYDELIDIARHFEGLLASWGCHASACIIFPDNPINYCAIEKQGDTFVAAYDYHDLEDMSLIKLDLLGLRNLTVIHETLKLIPDKLDIYHLPLDDKEVFKRYSNGNTTGIFQTESAVMRQYAKKMNVHKFEDIVALISLVRPGPLDSGMADQYIKGNNGEEIEVLHPLLDKILGRTHQVLIFQEQLMAISRELAKYSLGEADGLRKVVGRKELDKIDVAVKEFIERAIKNGIQKDIAEEIGRVIKACGRYIFNQSHGALYSMTSYITAYLLVHYPIFYMCALLNSVIDDQEKTIEYINECKRINIPILPPDITKQNTQWVIEDDSLRMSLTYIKGIGNNIDLSDISSFEKIIENNNKRVLEALIRSGSLDNYGERAYLLALVEPLKSMLKNISNYINKIKEWEEKGNEKKVDEWKQKLSSLSAPKVEPLKDYNEIAGEYEVLGMSFKQLPKVKEGVIKSIRKKDDKNGNEMAWIVFDSIYGEIKSTVFYRQWKKLKKIIEIGKKYKFINDDKEILQDIKALV